jgi:hypothetical protein
MGQYIGAVVRRVIAETVEREKVVAEFAVTGGDVTDLHRLVSDWLEQVLEEVYVSLSELLGSHIRKLAERDASNLLLGKYVHIGWKRSDNASFAQRASGRIVEWVKGAPVFHDAALNVTYYPILLRAEVEQW